MKKFTMTRALLCISVCLLSSVQLWATANIFAFGLTGAIEEDGYHITYSLNETATAVEFQAIDDEGEIIKSIVLTSMDKGDNTAVIDTEELPAGSYRWQIKATAESVASVTKISDEAQSQMQFWGPRGLAIDNNMESPFFGRIYVSDTQGGKVTEGITDGSGRTTTNGIYILDPLLQDVTGQGSTAYGGGYAWTGAGTPYRLCVAQDGKVYMANLNTNYSGVYIMDPANPAGAFTAVFGGTHTNGILSHEGVDIAGKSTVCWVLGTGAGTELYVFDQGYKDADNGVVNGMNLLRYDIGENESPWTSAPSAVVYNNNPDRQLNGNGCILPDGRGNWWISQNRGVGNNNAGVPSLIHINSSGLIDYNSGNDIAVMVCSQTGGMAISADYSKLVIGTTAKNVAVFNITFDENDVPTLALERNFATLGNNTQGLALDPAGNVYVVSNSNERLSAWALPKEDNSHTTTAPSQYTINGTRTATGIDGLSKDQRFKFYPNPVNSQLNVEARFESIQSLQVYSITGSLVYELHNTGSQQQAVDMSALPQGSYLLRVNNETFKIMKR